MTNKTLSLVVLAAGLGRRYGTLKQLDPMGPNGEFLLDYSVFDALRAGFERVVFVIRRDFETAFRSSIAQRYSGRIKVDFVFQDLFDVPEGFRVPSRRERPWGTLHAVRAARHSVDGPFAVINADDYYGQDAYCELCRYFATMDRDETATGHYCMVGYPVQHTLSVNGGVNRGVCTESDGYLVAIEECTQIVSAAGGDCRGINSKGEWVRFSGDALASMNCWGFTTAIFGQIERFFSTFLNVCGHEIDAECYIPSVVDDLIHKGEAKCRILKTDGEWFGVTYPQDKPESLANIRRLVKAGVYKENLWL